ncbi:MAG: MarR family transcriptional regulator [Cyclobacteriaceae bacterium]
MVEEEKIVRFTEALEMMMMKMQEVDNTCIEVTKDISKRDFSIIVFVGKKEEVIMREIAEYLQIPVSTTTGIVDKLVENGYLSRFHSSTDRRIIKVELSSSGKKSFNLLKTSLYNMANTVLGDLTIEEREQFIGLLEKVTVNLEKHVPVPQE